MQIHEMPSSHWSDTNSFFLSFSTHIFKFAVNIFHNLNAGHAFRFVCLPDVSDAWSYINDNKEMKRTTDMQIPRCGLQRVTFLSHLIWMCVRHFCTFFFSLFNCIQLLFVVSGILFCHAPAFFLSLYCWIYFSLICWWYFYSLSLISVIHVC